MDAGAHRAIENEHLGMKRVEEAAGHGPES
jgi:hypothetical protein